jgi:hypothetical protein
MNPDYNSHSIFLRSILILYPHLRLGLPSGIFPSSIRPKFVSILISPMRATYPVHLILLDFPAENDSWLSDIPV